MFVSGDFDEPAVGAFGKGTACEKPKQIRERFCMFLLKDHLLSEKTFFDFSYSLELFLVVSVRMLRLGLDLVWDLFIL